MDNAADEYILSTVIDSALFEQIVTLATYLFGYNFVRMIRSELDGIYIVNELSDAVSYLHDSHSECCDTGASWII